MSNIQTIMLVEDDDKLASLLHDYLSNFGFDVVVVHSGIDAVEKILSIQPSLVVLDLMLPGLDGLSVCRKVRSQFSGRILMLTASGDDMDQVAALEIGADDFVQKPIQPRVLLARIKNLLRRDQGSTEATTSAELNQASRSDKEKAFGSLWLNESLQRCKLNDELVPLTPSEFLLLWHLVKHAEQVLSREELLQSLRNIEYDGLDRSVDNKIAQIRKKLKDDANRPQGVITVRGKGYMFVPDYW
ncbi:response regulator transcription factor [Pseudoalteromonas sp. Scap03]|jgi:two-component system response regulator RstA|uniref:response regulator transcription factor n=1 Tax=unclassified Pseudoalteromonas TaxID=194690 RepID=UPI0015B902A7|nr:MULTISPECIES: response regulator transcription factor [unclassified Pseudoalteromonas]NWL17542.1 response regulator transcription factor [Pseudoalteromonas sp. Scap03]QLE83573.1 response regulator transcription factor [Pseudoalteromonas sp. Scap25]QLE91515.1 response regulator transcription factor [Pseudoalteromonas sp. Scap06]